MSKSFIQIRYERLKKKKRRNIILNIVCLLIAGSGLAWTANYFWRYISYEITNDAFVDQYVAPVNVRVSGYIQEVRFREHQYADRIHGIVNAVNGSEADCILSEIGRASCRERV